MTTDSDAATAPTLQAVDHQRWSPRRWAVSIVAAFALQAVLLIYFSRYPSDEPPAIPLRTALHLAAEPWSSQQLALLQTYRDPTLFALPNVHSFSGAGWLKFRPMEHHFLDWHEPPPWLELSGDDLGETFHQYIDQSASAPLRIADKPLPPRAGTELLVPNLSLPDESTLRLEGDLAGRTVLDVPRLRSWHYSDILSNTVIRAVADEGGRIFSVTMTQSSGLPEADLYALRLAQTARLAPRESEAAPPKVRGMTWGRMVFQWHTLPPQEGTEPAGAVTPLPAP